jgi:hypothetical protein
MEGKISALLLPIPASEGGLPDKLVAPFRVPDILKIPSVRQKVLRNYYSWTM